MHHPISDHGAAGPVAGEAVTLVIVNLTVRAGIGSMACSPSRCCAL